jgi:DNA-binding IclR family transcriptional regulator
MTVVLTPESFGLSVPTDAQLRNWQKRTILEWLSYEGPSLTSAELASCGFDRRLVGRRLRTLERGGVVERASQRRCSETGRKVITWRAVAWMCEVLSSSNAVKGPNAYRQ